MHILSFAECLTFAHSNRLCIVYLLLTQHSGAHRS